ncbi:uncharacterized protein LOC143297705 [Babylonia areolata]|uniref:uncharacterized protein LOC143297705 n=1 Tax=Babylonia areolata TaxID=304850 RepID=UPI003FD47248
MYAAPTERLQTWHQPRPKPVSPKKVSDIASSTTSNFSTTVDFSRKDFCLEKRGDGLYHLKQSHKYYTQIQMQIIPYLGQCQARSISQIT